VQVSTQNYASGEYAPGEFLGAVGRAQSYLNILYLLLSLPLGIFYFVFLAVGMSVGMSLVILWVGLPILVLVLAAGRVLANGERQLAHWLLDAPIGRVETLGPGLRHPWAAFKALVGEGQTWGGLLFLLLKFPLGIFSFLLTVSLLAVSTALILVPLAFQYVPVNVGTWPITSADAALVCLAAGLILAVVSIYVLNGIAAVWRALAQALLTPRRAVTAATPHTGPIIIP
jgi:hypothetical protein